MYNYSKGDKVKVVCCIEEKMYKGQSFTVVDSYFSDEKQQVVVNVISDVTHEEMCFKQAYLRVFDMTKETLEDLRKNGIWSDENKEFVCRGRYIASACADSDDDICDGCGYEEDCHPDRIK